MKAPAFQFYAQDFLTGCTYLTNEEIGMYIKMLCKQWTDGNIPKKRLGFLLGLEWVSLSEELKGKFIDFGEYVINDRLEKEREKKNIFREKQSENGKKGGRPKKNDNLKNIENIENTSEEEEKEAESQIKPNPFKNTKPNKNQKKPLEDRSMKIEEENEIEEEEERKEGLEKKQEVEFPFFTENFKVQWQLWKVYKSKEFKFNYKSTQSEQASLMQLNNLSGNDEKTAIAIMHQSMSNGWKGFFELKKNNQNGQQNSNSQFKTVSSDFARQIAEGLQSK
jgi:uncharacterized protein YdaU (DUF1376 family)